MIRRTSTLRTRLRHWGRTARPELPPHLLAFRATVLARAARTSQIPVPYRTLLPWSAIAAAGAAAFVLLVRVPTPETPPPTNVAQRAPRLAPAVEATTADFGMAPEIASTSAALRADTNKLHNIKNVEFGQATGASIRPSRALIIARAFLAIFLLGFATISALRWRRHSPP